MFCGNVESINGQPLDRTSWRQPRRLDSGKGTWPHIVPAASGRVPSTAGHLRSVARTPAKGKRLGCPSSGWKGDGEFRRAEHEGRPPPARRRAPGARTGTDRRRSTDPAPRCRPGTPQSSNDRTTRRVAWATVGRSPYCSWTLGGTPVLVVSSSARPRCAVQELMPRSRFLGRGVVCWPAGRKLATGGTRRLSSSSPFHSGRRRSES